MLRGNDVTISALLRVVDAWNSADAISNHVLSFFFLFLARVIKIPRPAEGGTLSQNHKPAHSCIATDDAASGTWVSPSSWTTGCSADYNMAAR